MWNEIRNKGYATDFNKFELKKHHKDNNRKQVDPQSTQAAWSIVSTGVRGDAITSDIGLIKGELVIRKKACFMSIGKKENKAWGSLGV